MKPDERLLDILLCARGVSDMTPKRLEVSFEALFDRFFAAARFSECEQNPQSPIRCQEKDCEHKRNSPALIFAKGKGRTDKQIESCSALVYDFDDLSEEGARFIGNSILERNLAFILHSTHKGLNHWRLIIPLAENVPAEMWAGFYKGAAVHLRIEGFDPTCANPSRIFFTPVVSKDVRYMVVQHLTGDLLAIGGIQRRAELMSKDDPLMLSLAEGIAFAKKGERDHTLNAVASRVAFRYPTMPTSEFIELVTRSLEPIAEPEGLEHWQDVARGCFKRALARKAEEDTTTERRRSGGKLLAAQDLTRECPELLLGVRFNTLSRKVEVLPTCPLYVTAGVAKSVVDLVEWHIALRLWLASKGVDVKSNDAAELLYEIAMRNSFDPLGDYLHSLKWDKTKRLHLLLRDYFCGKESHEYLSLIGRKWMISAIARAMRPGCQADAVLVLEGQQGLGKTQGVRVLGGPFVSTLNVSHRYGEKDSLMALMGYWILELAELPSFGKDINAQKSFLTETVDNFRPPYARAPKPFPRRCVFVGTTNDHGYLADPTGNRRYWPTRLTSVDLEALERDKDQLFAEAKAAWESGEPWHLTTDAEKRLVEEEVEKRNTDPSNMMHIQLKTWLQRENYPANLTMLRVFQEALVRDPFAPGAPALMMQCGEVLRKLGYTKHGDTWVREV